MEVKNGFFLNGLRKDAKHEKVVEELNQLILITEILTIDKKTISLALNSKFNDFEDAL